MKTITRLVAPALATLLVCANLPLARQAAAQSPGLQDTFTLDRAASQDTKQAVDEVADQMSFLTASIAHNRLMATNPTVGEVTFSSSGQAVTIRADDGAALTTRTDGTPIDWVAEDGEKVKVSTVWAGTPLKGSLTSGRGLRFNTYALDAAGNTLTRQMVVTASQLPAPLDYRLVFGRAS